VSFTVIGITGPKRSGKNTVASLIGCLADQNFVQVSLADPIKDGFDRLSGSGRELHKDLDESGWTNRQAWQLAGTEARDAAGDPLLWCKLAKLWLTYLTKFHPRRYTRFTIPDIRFPHEEEFFRREIRAMGGTFFLWGVTSPRAKGDAHGHASERFFDSLTPDVRINNNLSKWVLTGTVNRLLGETVV
jgi:hypothetical protein